MNIGDTIAAISSSAGRSARMILRLSGPQAFSIASKSCPQIPEHPLAVLTHLFWASTPLPCWVYRFNKPKSYTGEDLLELHIPGNPLIARELLGEFVKQGARLAEAGEFTARAFFNGKINLTQAEGVAGIISAQGREELEASRRLLSGELATLIKPLMEALADLLARVEAGIDFSDQDISFIDQAELGEALNGLLNKLSDILSNSGRFDRLTHEVEMVLAGRPNAGKSTLLNALCGKQRAVVSAQSGTTRDRLSAEVVLKRGKIRLIDIAGIDEESPVANSSVIHEIGQKMKSRALEEIQKAHRLIEVRDLRDTRKPLNFERPADLVVLTHADLSGEISSQGLRVSAMTGEGMEELLTKLDELAFGEPRQGLLTLNARHVNALQEAEASLKKALFGPIHQHETIAFELRTALDELGKITGNITPDDVLGRVFSAFCIGK